MFNFIKKKKEKPSIIFDFYVNDIDFVVGRINKLEDSKITQEIKTIVTNDKKFSNFKVRLQDKNFGYSADWSVILAEWLANDKWVNAISNLGGLVAFSEYFHFFVKNLKDKYNDNKIFVGLASARLIGFHKVFESEKDQIMKFSYDIVFEREISRQGSFEEKDFIFLIRRTFENKDLKLFFIHISWQGEVKHFYEI